MGDQIPVCKNCKHYEARPWGILRAVHGCMLGYIDMVTGDICVAECETERTRGVCGKSGRNYVPNTGGPYR